MNGDTSFGFSFLRQVSFHRVMSRICCRFFFSKTHAGLMNANKYRYFLYFFLLFFFVNVLEYIEINLYIVLDWKGIWTRIVHLICFAFAELFYCRNVSVDTIIRRKSTLHGNSKLISD